MMRTLFVLILNGEIPGILRTLHMRTHTPKVKHEKQRVVKTSFLNFD